MELSGVILVKSYRGRILAPGYLRRDLLETFLLLHGLWGVVFASVMSVILGVKNRPLLHGSWDLLFMLYVVFWVFLVSLFVCLTKTMRCFRASVPMHTHSFSSDFLWLWT